MLAAKAALAVRYDAFGEDINTDMGVDNMVKLTSRLKSLESGFGRQISGQGKWAAKQEKYVKKE